MRMQPGMTVVAPADQQQTPAALEATWDVPGPVYYRLGKEEEALSAASRGPLRLGRAERVRPARTWLCSSSEAWP